MDSGIYIGNENSAIAKMEDGEPLILKTRTLKDTMPTCVYINKNKVSLVGDKAYNAMKVDKLKAMRNFQSSVSNSFIEFIRTMGTDKTYYSPNMDRNFSSEELTAEVLKALKSFNKNEDIKAAVITVPAKFTVNQKDATRKAGELAGFKHIELLQEPIAASMAYGLDAADKNGYWLVFDFGGGTFDAALLRVEEGIMKVIDTEGDNHLGGKNLDYAIVDEIIIPYLQDNYAVDSIINDEQKKKILQDAMKFYAEETKISMSFNETYNVLSDLGEIPGEDDEGEEFELDITVTQEMMRKTLGPIFQQSINICKELLERNHLSAKELDSLILVGGPTYSPVLKEMLEEQITKPDTSADPMTVVAKGAALYASTIDVSEEIRENQRGTSKIQLELGYEATTVEEEEMVTVKILKNKTQVPVPENIYAEIVRSDKTWSSGRIAINELGEVIEVKLKKDRANSFIIFLYDDKGNLLDSEPSEFTIIQGTKIGNATLPYNIGLSIKDELTGNEIFKTIKGLEKNQSLPATGTERGLKTQKQIRPGIKDDFITIPIYQGDYGAEGTKAVYNEHVYDVVITGENFDKLLPENSDVDLTIKVDRSEKIYFSADIPYLDYTHEIKVPHTKQEETAAEYLEKEIKKARQSLYMLEQDGFVQDEEELSKLEEELTEIDKRFEQAKNDSDRKKQTLNNLRKTFKKLEKLQESSEWPKTEEELKRVFYQLEETNNKYGDMESKRIVEQFKEQIPEIIKDKNVKVAAELIDNIKKLDSALMDNLNKEKVLHTIDDLKTQLIDNLEENKNLTKDIFTDLFNTLFELGENIEKNDVVNEFLYKQFKEIEKKVENILNKNPNIK